MDELVTTNSRMRRVLAQQLADIKQLSACDDNQIDEALVALVREQGSRRQEGSEEKCPPLRRDAATGSYRFAPID